MTPLQQELHLLSRDLADVLDRNHTDLADPVVLWALKALVALRNAVQGQALEAI